MFDLYFQDKFFKHALMRLLVMTLINKEGKNYSKS